MRKQVLIDTSICRDDLLKRESNLQGKTETTFSLTYYPVFKNVRKILEEIHLLLKPDQAHKKVFSGTPIIGFKNANSLKDHLVRAVLPQLDREGRSKPCHGANRSCEVFESVKETTKFKKAESEETFDILKGPLDCIATMWYIFLDAENVSLNSLMELIQSQKVCLDLTTIKVLTVSLERNWKKELFKKFKDGN